MEMNAEGVVVNMTIQITRANNGAVETFDLKLTGVAEPQSAPVVHEVVGGLDAQQAGMDNIPQV